MSAPLPASPVSFVPIYPSSGWPQRWTFAPAVRVGRTIWISGLTATDEHMKIVGVGDMAAQTRQIFRKMDALLHEVGGALRNIVDTTDYVTTFENYAATADVRREMFAGGPYPAATGVLVAGLIRKDALIEIKATAVLDKEPA